MTPTPDPVGPDPTGAVTFDDYVEVVLRIVERIPRGRATTYGDVAAAAREICGRGGPRQVGKVMALHGAGTPWWRVVRADGRMPEKHGDEARQQHLAEGTFLRGARVVDLERSGWDPLEPGPSRP